MSKSEGLDWSGIDMFEGEGEFFVSMCSVEFAGEFSSREEILRCVIECRECYDFAIGLKGGFVWDWGRFWRRRRGESSLARHIDKRLIWCGYQPDDMLKSFRVL